MRMKRVSGGTMRLERWDLFQRKRQKDKKTKRQKDKKTKRQKDKKTKRLEMYDISLCGNLASSKFKSQEPPKGRRLHWLGSGSTQWTSGPELRLPEKIQRISVSKLSMISIFRGMKVRTMTDKSDVQMGRLWLHDLFLAKHLSEALWHAYH